MDGKPKNEEFSAFTNSQRNTIVNEFETYEDYLDNQITAMDLFYLEDLELARQLVEMGYRSNVEVLSREEFIEFKTKAEVARIAAQAKLPTKLYSTGKDVSAYPFLSALQEREKPIRDGKLSTVIFIRDYTRGGQEVSGYIDYAERMRTDDLEPIFLRKRRFFPKQGDLLYFHWLSNISTTTGTTSWEVIAKDETGMLLKNKLDRKMMRMDPTLASPGDNSTRTMINSGEYEQIVIFDHVTRRKL